MHNFWEVHLLYVTSVPGLSVYLHWLVPGTHGPKHPCILCVFMDPVGFPEVAPVVKNYFCQCRE